MSLLKNIRIWIRCHEWCVSNVLKSCLQWFWLWGDILSTNLREFKLTKTKLKEPGVQKCAAKRMVFPALREQDTFFNLQFSKYVKNESECFDSSQVPNTERNSWKHGAVQVQFKSFWRTFTAIFWERWCILYGLSLDYSIRNTWPLVLGKLFLAPMKNVEKTWPERIWLNTWPTCAYGEFWGVSIVQNIIHNARYR